MIIHIAASSSTIPIYSVKKRLEIIDRWLNLLRFVADQPECNISHIPIPLSNELTAINQFDRINQPPLSNDCSVPDFYHLQAQHYPDDDAVYYHGQNDHHEKITYGELESRSNRLANYLKHIGVNKGTRVGVCITRSIDLIVAIVAAHVKRAAYSLL